MELDYIRYMLGFPTTRMLLNSEGNWQVQVNQVCGFLDEETDKCTVHDTPRKPKTCVFFNPYQCWYKRNFTTAPPTDVIPIDLEAFEVLLAHIKFDGDGRITDIPSWETIRDVVRGNRERNDSSDASTRIAPLAE